MNLPLDGCTVVVTRERPGELARLLVADGAQVVHVPLIEVVDADSADLVAGWASSPDWVVVTSVAGAERVAGEVAARPDVRTAAVGTATAAALRELTGRAVDLVPTQQLAASLVEAFIMANPTPQRVLIAQADRAASTLADGLMEAGHHVLAVTAYRTLTATPGSAERSAIRRADAVVFASGSAATGWAEAFGPTAAEILPPIVVAIGPTTAGVAAQEGLKISHVSADHSLAGIVVEMRSAWATPRST